MENDILIIGIAGPSAGGKTTVANDIVDNFDKDIVTIISFDDYYKDQSHMEMETRYKTNYDHPNAFDIDLLLEDIKLLRKGITISKPIYDFTKHNRSLEVEQVKPTKIIVIEGLFVLLDKRIVDMLDIKLYVETDSDECFIRRLLRDIEGRGRTMDQVVDQYLKTVKPMYLEFIKPTKINADIIIPRGGGNNVAIELIVHKILGFIK